MRKALIYCLIASAWWSCVEVPTQPPPPDYSVYSVLSPDEPQVAVFLANVYERGEAFPTDSLKYAPNARVMLYAATDSLRLSLNPRTKRYEAPNKGFVQPGQTYRLRVETATGQVLRATTQVPARPVLEVLEAKAANQLGTLQ